MLIREEEGFTLIEMLVSIAIIFVLVSSIYQILSTFSRNFEIQDGIAEMQQQGRFSADLISREIRQAGYDPRGVFFNGGLAGNPFNNCDGIDAAAQGIFEAGPKVFHFLADLNGNGLTGDANEHTRYEWVDASGKDICDTNRVPMTLYRNTGGGMQPVSSNIVGFNFQYFNDENNPIPDAQFDPDGNLIPNTLALTANERSGISKVILTLTARTDRRDKNYRNNGGYRTRTFVYNIWLKNT